MKAKNKKLLKAAGILVIGILLGWLLFGGADKKEDKLVENQHIESSDHQEIWTCSMHPQIRQSEPGACPICGMDLIPVNTEDAGTDPDSYQMSENAIKLANITSEIVGMGSASKEIRLNGKVQVDERNSYSQSTHIPGRIEQLTINFTGEKVSKGQTLAMVYSPELVNAQEELLQAASIKASQPELFEAAKEKLRNWKIGNSQIDRILANGKAIQRFPIGADVNGIVTEKMVELGDYVDRGMPLYEISDLSKVWVLFDLYESELAWVKEGSKIKYTVNSIPGETFEGTISFVDPIINSQTRVASARIEVNNKDGRLKPEMFVSGVVKNEVSKTDTQEIVIPKSAVLWTGTRSVVYMKEIINGRSSFKLREVVLGPGLGDSYIIKKGLTTGEEIVTNGTFTVDAAVQLSGRPSMMNPKTETAVKTSESFVKVAISDKEKQHFQPVLNNYLKFKDALVNDDFSSANKLVTQLNKQIKEIKRSQFQDETAKSWESFKKELVKDTNAMTAAKDIQGIRNNFDEFSETIIGMVNTFQLSNKEIYVLHCPMANNNKGAFWLSESSEVKNPYYGSAMLTCGSIKDTIK